VKVAIFGAKKYDREFLNAANGSRHELRFFEPHLNEETAGLAGASTPSISRSKGWPANSDHLLVLLCKNCVAVCAAHPRRMLFSRRIL